MPRQKVSVTIALDLPELDRLERVLDQQRISRSQFARSAIYRALEQAEQELESKQKVILRTVREAPGSSLAKR